MKVDRGTIVFLVVLLAVSAGLATGVVMLRGAGTDGPPGGGRGEGGAVGGGAAAVTASDIETSPDATGLPALFEAPKFALKNQDGKAVSAADLAGHPYVAAFIFTHCTSVCPMMTGKMSGLQDAIPEKAVKLVSFTVDPARDTPETLKTYAAKFGADDSRWFFLTGTKDEMVAVEKGFYVRLPRPDPTSTVADPKLAADDPMQLMPHSDRFILVDGQGRVRGIYDSKDESAMAKLKTDSAKLAKTGS